MLFNGIPLSNIVLCLLASFGSVSAAPSPFDYPEVIPGPGMPSLSSLGLTSKDLYEATAPLAERGLSSRSFCDDHRCGPPTVGNAQACINYLRNLGTQRCGVRSSIVMCTAGDAVISASTRAGVSETSSYCSDVAIGGQYIINNCKRGDGTVAGEDVANGNGDLFIWISRC